MDERVLVNNGDKYSGQYVATKSFADKNVISFGCDPVKVSQEAKMKGIDRPAIYFIPKKHILPIHKCR